jgi:hypothetical protein
MNLDVKLDIEDVKEGLLEMGLEVPNVSQKLRQAVMTGAKNRVKHNMGNYLNLGHLVGSSGGKILTGKKGKTFKGSLQQRVYGYSRSATHSVVAAPRYIAEPLEKGVTIAPKKGAVLTFQGSDGKIHRAHQVTIPARHWFTLSLGEYEGSAEVSEALAAAEERLIRKFEGSA